MKFSDWLLLVITASTFATSLPLNKVLISDFPVVTLSATRALLALPFIYLITLVAGAGIPYSYSEWRSSLIGGIFLLVCPFSAIAFGQQYIPSGVGGILYGLMPLLTVIMASVLIVDERFTLPKLFGCVIGFIGTALVFGPAALDGLENHVLGASVTLLAPLSYAIGSVLLRKAPPCNPLKLSTGMFMVGTLVLLPLAFLSDGWPTAISLNENKYALIGLATLGTALPASLNYILIRRIGAVDASIVMFVMPVFAVSMGWFLFAERIGMTALLGMLLIVFACFIVTRFGNSSLNARR